MAKEVLVAGNFKAKIVHGSEWISSFLEAFPQDKVASSLQLVVCPSYTQLAEWHKGLERQAHVALGAQDVSAFPSGAHTGEVTGEMLQAQGVSYVIIGHSERRSGLGETDELLQKKVDVARAHGLEVIYCVPDEKTHIPAGIRIAAYEPLAAIGSGNPDTPENANEVAGIIKNTYSISRVLYGGSVKPENVASFIAQEHIDGVLVGGASLQGDMFGKLALHASGG